MMAPAERRLLLHIRAAQWRADRARLRIIESALAKIDPSLPADIQEAALEPYVQLLDDIGRHPNSAGRE